MAAATRVPAPRNEPGLTYATGSAERHAPEPRPPAPAERPALETCLRELAGDPVQLTATVGGRQRMASGEKSEVVHPHRHAAVPGTSAHSTHADAQAAIRAAKAAAPAWRDLSY